MNLSVAWSESASDVGAPLPHNSYQDNLAFRNQPQPPQQHRGGGMSVAHGPYGRRNQGNSRNVLLSNRDTAHMCRDVIHATYDGEKSVAKAAASDSGMSAKAAENWMLAQNPMSLTAFLNAYHRNPTFKAWARKILLMEEEIDPAFQAELHRFIAAAQRAGSGS